MASSTNLFRVRHKSFNFCKQLEKFLSLHFILIKDERKVFISERKWESVLKQQGGENEDLKHREAVFVDFCELRGEVFGEHDPWRGDVKI